MILTVSYLMGTRHLFFMCLMLPEVMHESWIESIEQVICHILFKNITKLHFLESQLLSTCLEYEKGSFLKIETALSDSITMVLTKNFCIKIFSKK
jgi:hypothetical protein